MNHDHDSHDNHRPNSRANWILLGFIAVAAFFLITEHRAHLFGYLPFLLLLACPLMHLFHGGHGGHGQQGNSAEEPSGNGKRDDKPQGHQGHTTKGDE